MVLKRVGGKQLAGTIKAFNPNTSDGGTGETVIYNAPNINTADNGSRVTGQPYSDIDGELIWEGEVVDVSAASGTFYADMDFKVFDPSGDRIYRKSFSTSSSVGDTFSFTEPLSNVSTVRIDYIFNSTTDESRDSFVEVDANLLLV